MQQVTAPNGNKAYFPSQTLGDQVRAYWGLASGKGLIYNHAGIEVARLVDGEGPFQLEVDSGYVIANISIR
jgi:hypothetical protein